MDIKRIVMAGGVLATAGAIGFVMRHGESAQARYAVAPVADISGTPSEPLEVTGIELTSAVAGKTSKITSNVDVKKMGAKVAPEETKEEPVTRTAALDDVALPSMEEPAQPELQSLCNIEMAAEAAAAVMVDISLKATATRMSA